jgi:hypothetical protein
MRTINLNRISKILRFEQAEHLSKNYLRTDTKNDKIVLASLARMSLLPTYYSTQNLINIVMFWQIDGRLFEETNASTHTHTHTHSVMLKNNTCTLEVLFYYSSKYLIFQI